MSLDVMRDLLKDVLARSLQDWGEEDRLAAAWPVASGRVMSERARVVGYADGVVQVEVSGETWLRQMMSMRGQLAAELGRVARVKVREIHFVLKRN